MIKKNNTILVDLVAGETVSLVYDALDSPLTTKGELSFIQKGVKRVIANELRIVAVYKVSRRWVLFGRPIARVNLKIWAHRFAREGVYRFEGSLVDGSNNESPVSFKVTVQKNKNKVISTPTPPSQALLNSIETLSPIYSTKQSDTKDDGYTPVIMAVWKRIDNLHTTIVDLRNQTVRTRLVLWVNNPEIVDEVVRLVEQEDELPVTVYASKNLGGFARFYAARKIKADKVVFIDDDQRLATDTIQRLLSYYSPKTVVGNWAFQFRHPNNYWLKMHLRSVVEADYAGTGGMIVDSSIFQDDRLFSEVPKRYWFIEDLWLSWFASHKGYRVYGCNAGIKINKDGKDQMSGLIDLKSEFYKYLSKKGASWNGRMQHFGGMDTFRGDS